MTTRLALLLLVSVCAGCGSSQTAEETSSSCPADLREHFPTATDDLGAYFPSWSPDGNRIAFAAGSDLLVLTVADCGVAVVRPGGADLWMDAIDWSPDGERFVFANGPSEEGEGLFVMQTDGSGLRRLTQGNVLFPAWSPDGKRIAFLRDLVNEVEATEDRNVWVVADDGTGLRRVTTGRWHGSADWSPDGEWLVTDADAEVIRIRPDGSGRETLIGGEHPSPSWSPDGETLVVEGPMLAPGKGGELEVLDGVEGGGFEPAWSPDGKWIAVTDGADSSDLWILRRDGSGARQLTRADDR